MQKRDIVTFILLSIVTCGIYSLYWFVVTTNEIESELNEKDGTLSNGGTALLLDIVTCGIYGIYWYYKQGQRIAKLQRQVGLPEKDNSTTYLLLSVFGFGIIASALMQDDLNKYVDAKL
ncbi:MAG: DUF4234 domain-containing protein [Clostridiales bacterium]|nr:DUF4234 domain-containing protein [Clostridiales bacterium]